LIGGIVGEFSRFKALSFDCYGTLIDWETGILAELTPWADRHGLRVSADDLLTRFARIETEVERRNGASLYPTILALVLDQLADGLGTHATADECASFGGSVGQWPAFPDSAEALGILKRYFKLIILSNVDRSSFALSNDRLGVEFDVVITAQDVGTYKPNPANFRALIEALKRIGVARTELLHVAQSLYHDHEPAQAAGLPTVWIDRRHAMDGFGATPAPRGSTVTVDWRYTSMQQFASAVEESSRRSQA
jgi:2-haloacid dehalogenase